ncbi:hypothetical protein GIB67_017022 [Kingdonia uniflora]|uniref:Aminotransferase-like plant mobile domain-containing protein n=1 Tax=Kingdonia uniflora TaxID=39325 RepID=A0A7J7LRN3_9MAGN|nr:hypothetical protein GIB67_017022 [Kingdonia uniflora]
MEPTTSWNLSPMKMKVMFPKCDFYRARSGKSLTKNSMSPPNLLHLSRKIMNHMTFGDSHNRMGMARVGSKCRSVLVKLREMYLIIIDVPHLKQKLKVTNLMSLFDYKIGNSDNQVIMSMVERWWATSHTFHLPYGELGITPRYLTVHTEIGIRTGEPMVLDESYTEYGNALRIFPDMESEDYEKGCISFAHLQTYLNHTRVNIKDPVNTNTIFRAFMLLYFGDVLFGNSKSWAQLELLGPIAILDKKGPMIDFGSCYEYCQIGHHILIENRLDDFWPRMSVWHIKRRKLTGNKAKHHLALMRQQLDLCTINNIPWDPFRNMKDVLKWDVIIAVPYDPPEKLYCFPSPDVHVSHGTLMSDIARCGNIDISGLGALTDKVTFPHVEFPTGDFSTQDTQIPPLQLGDYPEWIMEFTSPHGTTWHTIPFIVMTSTVDVPTKYDFFSMTGGMQKLTLDRTLDLEAQHLHDESRCITHSTADLRFAEGRIFQLNDYLDGEGIVVDWEDVECETGTSQAGTSRGRGSQGRRSRGRTSEEEEEEEDIDESSTDYSDDDVINAIKMEILYNYM